MQKKDRWPLWLRKAVKKKSAMPLKCFVKKATLYAFFLSEAHRRSVLHPVDFVAIQDVCTICGTLHSRQWCLTINLCFHVGSHTTSRCYFLGLNKTLSCPWLRKHHQLYRVVDNLYNGRGRESFRKIHVSTDYISCRGRERENNSHLEYVSS